MRGKVTDQDLTNYALNELSPEERLYVESMLGVSEECRHDVYRMLDLGEMLKEGFEVHEDAADLLLNHEQRDRVLTVPRFQWRGFLQRAAAIALLATGIGYGLSKEVIWRRGLQVAADAKQTIDNLGSQNLATSAEQFIAYSMKRANPADPADAQLDVANCTPPVMAADMMPMPDSGDM
jgi:anti-sigma factor RsiW